MHDWRHVPEHRKDGITVHRWLLDIWTIEEQPPQYMLLKNGKLVAIRESWNAADEARGGDDGAT